MATKKIATVSFSPAELKDGFISIRLSLVHGSANHDVEFTTLPELVAEVTRLGTDFGTGCSAYVRMKGNARKPAGFDSATRNLFFNLEEKAN